jgi:hypothetical protein
VGGGATGAVPVGTAPQRPVDRRRARRDGPPET